jgi:hypothetical protein
MELTLSAQELWWRAYATGDDLLFGERERLHRFPRSYKV